MAFMSKFKVGDKVRMLAHDRYPGSGAGHYFEGAVGYINELYNGLWVIWGEKNRDGNYFGHFAENELELVTAKKEITPPFYVDCPTEEIWDRVEQKMFDMGYKWRGKEQHIDFSRAYGTQTKIEIDSVRDMGYGTKEYIYSKHIPYQEFLGEDKKDNVCGFKVGDTVKVIKWDTSLMNVGEIHKISEYYPENAPYCWRLDNGGCIRPEWMEKVEAPKTPTEEKIYFTSTPRGSNWMYDEFKKYYSCDWVLDTGKPIKSFTQRIMDTLRSIPDRLKRALNANLRAFYKLGWIDGDLEVTGNGREELTNFLFDKFEKELGAIALKRVKDASKKKKDEDEEESEDEE